MPAMEPLDTQEAEREIFALGHLEVGMAARGSLRWASVDLSDVVEAARGRLDLSPVAAAALGRALSGAALLLRMAVKTPARLLLELAGDGPLRQVLAEVDEDGTLRGSVGNPHANVPDRPDGKLAVGAAIGQGRLRVLREHATGSYHSQVELVSGEVGEDLAHYLVQSEQTPSVVLVGVLTRPRGVAAAGGMVVEVLPGAAPEAVAKLEENLGRIDGISRLLEEGGRATVVSRVLAGLEPVVRGRHELRYTCRCSRARLERHLAALARAGEPLDNEQGEIVAQCSFCGEQYLFHLEEFLEPT
jgi:molecular chaperone Hsp33